VWQIKSVTAHTKCYSIDDEGSSVDCSIEDTKLKKEEGSRKGREGRGLKGLASPV
jgi:hypothetical protein